MWHANWHYAIILSDMLVTILPLEICNHFRVLPFSYCYIWGNEYNYIEIQYNCNIIVFHNSIGFTIS